MQNTSGLLTYQRLKKRKLSFRRFMLVPMLFGIITLGPASRSAELVLGNAGAITGPNEFLGVGTVGADIAVDSVGNSYISGSFAGSTDFDPGPGVFNLTSGGGEDAFVCKLDPSGALLWALAIGGPGTDRGAAIRVDNAENLYVSGVFTGTKDFDPGPGVFNLSSAGSFDTFICKLDASGALLWAGSLGGIARDDVYGIALDSIGNVYCTGTYEGTADFDPGPGTHNLVSGNDRYPYVVKLDSEGNFQWAGALRGATAWAESIVVDEAGGVLCAGRFEGNLDCDPGPGLYNLSSPGISSIFVCKMDDSSGDFQWAKAMTGTAYASALDIAIDVAGSLYCTGIFQGTLDLDPGPDEFNVSSSSGFTDVFICKLSVLGELEWAGAIGGAEQEAGYGVQVDGNGYVYIGGEFAGTSDFDPGPGAFILNSAGLSDAFLCVLDSSGELEWAGAFGGMANDRLNSIELNNASGVHGTGAFGLTADMDPGPGVYNQTAVGDFDAFIVRMEPKSLPVANGDFGATNADQLLTLLTASSFDNLLANDTDANTLDVLTITSHDATSALGAEVVVNPHGTFVYDPTAVAAFQALAPGDSLVDTFTYTLSDGTDSDIGTVTVTVYGMGASLPALGVWGVVILVLLLIVAAVLTQRVLE